MQVLTGHTGPETAYLVEDYPYGFRLRTSIRYWVETKGKHGQRLVSQTLNPKTGRWNKPKPSTYSMITVMFSDKEGHVHSDGIGHRASEEKIADFERLYAPALDDERERRILRYLRAARRADKRVTWTAHTCGPDCQEHHQTVEEQAAIMSAVTENELRRETVAALRGEAYP